MVNIVLVSKNLMLANGIKELVNQTVDRQVKIAIATNYQAPLDLTHKVFSETILTTIKKILCKQGVLVLLDTYTLAIANLDHDIVAHVALSSAPIVEGTLVATNALGGKASVIAD